MMNELRKMILCLVALLLLVSCGSANKESTEETVKTGTPVTVQSVHKSTMIEAVELNATSVFRLKTPIRSVATGYLQNVNFKQGDYVTKGEVLMTIITKEAESIGGTINSIDTSFHFKGQINIIAPNNGYISQLNFQSKDYVQDGEQVAIISDAKSFAFILELPYELTALVASNKNVQLILPDSTILNGVIEKPLPTVDAASQTQSYVISVTTKSMIPENLIAKVILVKSTKQHATAIPKEALLTDETQKDFWVMKVVNDSTAVKVMVKKGIEAHGMIEILSPLFTDSDQILISGNYGLPDTATIYLSK